jgi:uncharacterized membrane protein YfhO
MAVFVSNIVIEQGFDFASTFQLEDTVTNDILDLTDYTIESKLRKTYTSSTSISFTVTVSTPQNGQVLLSLTSAQTAELKAGRYVYDIKGTRPDGNVIKIIEGSALVRPGVTR